MTTPFPNFVIKMLKHNPTYGYMFRISIFTISPKLVCNIKKNIDTAKANFSVTTLTPNCVSNMYKNTVGHSNTFRVSLFSISPNFVCNPYKNRLIQSKQTSL